MIIYFHLAVILSVILSGIFLLRWRRGISVHFPMIFLVIPIINLGYLKVATAENEYEAILANGISYLDGCFLELFFFLYLISFCKLKPPKALTAVLLTVGSVVFFFSINTASNHLLYKSAKLRSMDGVSYLVKEYGPVHTVYYVMIAIYLLVNLSVLIYSFTRKNVSKINSLLLLIIYMIIIFAFLAGKSFHPAFELLPAAYTLSQILFLIVMRKINLYDISESAAVNIAEKGDIGFASFDLKKRYLGCTDPVTDCMPEFKELYIDKILRPENENYKKALDCISQVQDGVDAPHFYVTRNDVTYKVTAGYMYLGKKIIGYQLRTEDNTQESRMIEALKLREQQKEMEAKMLTLEKSAADAANKAKSSFLAEMSHEIRTPINAIIGMNEMILRTSDDEKTLEYSVNIDHASKTLLSLINSILDFSKIEDGKMEIVPVRYKTSELIYTLMETVSERAKNKGLRFRLEIDESLPSYLYGDDVRVSQVIQNLLTNAVKYTEKGSITLSIQNGGTEDERVLLKVSVKDTGIGIRAEDMDKLFESFSRLEEKRNRNIEGTGLGMSIVTKLLSIMGSELKVQSVYGEGSEFSFALYQKIADDRPMGSFSAGQAPASGRITKAVGLYAPDARVLVVDDNEMNLKVAQNLLGLFGIEPSVAHSGYEAIELIKQNDYMLILLDHMMPKLDGIETLTALKEGRLLKEGTKVIALSANAITGAREEYLAAGFDDYISKPIDIDELEKVLSRYLPESCIKARDNEELSDDNDAKMSSFESELPKNIDTAAGLKNCMDDESFYRELLSDYASSAEEKINRLESFKNDGLTEDYRILIHSIKSSSKTVGDLKAAELAQSLEAAAAGRDMPFINEHHREFCEGLKLTAELITKALS